MTDTNQRKNHQLTVKKSVLIIHSALAALSVFAAALPSHAQHVEPNPPAPEAAPASQPMAAVVVSASRIDRAGYSAPTPTTTIGANTLEQRATVNVGDVLNEIPSFRGTNTPAGGGIGNSGATLADLRGLTAVRTLVLLDRTRLPATSMPGTTLGGVTDLSIIPTALIKNIDVVTGGASAAYGSDAVAGVVNIVIDEKLDGIKANVQGGQTRYGDAREKFMSLAGGTDFADGRGHIIAGGEYSDNSGTDQYNTKRPWGVLNNASFPVPSPRPAGVPANLITDNVLFGSTSAGGLITQAASNPAALRGQEFVRTASGAVATKPFQFGQYATPTGQYMVGGTNVFNFQQLRPAVERTSFLSRATFKVTDDITAYIEPLIARVRTSNVSAQRRDGGGSGPALTFRADNYYLGQALTPAQLALVPASGLSIGYLGNELGAPEIDITSTTSRLMGGLRGKFGQGWKWDVSVQQGKNVLDQQITNVSNNTAWRNAIDAVQVTAANVGSSGLALGSVACRSTLTAPTNGCAPLNILGTPNVSVAAYAYVFGTATAHFESTLKEISTNVQGEPFSSWAGAVSLGLGLERRVESLETAVDALSQSGTWSARAPANLPISKVSVKEAYAETIIPLAKAAPFAKSLDLNAAVRRTDYSLSGAVTTWKTGLTWEPVADFKFRTTRSRDIRAPNLVELFTPTTTAVPPPTIRDPRAAFSNSYLVGATSGGNSSLQPERSDTTTFGLVFQPTYLKRLNVSADFYRIKVQDAIGSTAVQTVVDSCLAGGAVNPASSYCNLITYAGNDPVKGAITNVIGTQANVAQFRTHGVDMQLSYAQPLKELNEALAGTVNANISGTRVFEYWTSTDISALFLSGINRAGQTGSGFGGPAGLPKWMWNTSLTYRLKKLSLNAQVRYISRGHQNNGFVGPDDASYNAAASNSINTNIVPAVTYLHLGGAYDFGTSGRREVYVSINNVFDRSPPLPANNNAYYDLMGRTIKAGMRFSFD